MTFTTHNSQLPILIIGAGIGGLSSAIRLAAAGKRVIMLEQNANVGGKMSQIEQDGFRWDTGPSVITMRHVFEELFAVAGRNLADYLTLLPVDPLTRYFFRDGTLLDASSDLTKMAQRIAAIDERDVEGYLDFLAYAAKLHRITGPTFVYGEPPTLRRMSQLPVFDVFKIDPWLTMDQAIRRRVRSPQIQQFLARFATYVGASPYLAPATLSVIAHVELTGGVWYPQGGIYKIAEAMARLATELGVEIRTSCPVRQIVVNNGQAVAVETAQGERIAAAAVIANVDVTTVYHHLLPSTISSQRKRQQLSTTETSCSGFVMLLGVEGQHPQLAHHNIFFPPDYRREFDDIFRRATPPQDPTIYVAITSKSDPTHAPPGCENWFVLVNSPAIGPQFDWQQESERYADKIRTSLAKLISPSSLKIRTQVHLTPHDIARISGAWRGALYGISSNNALNAFRRPHNRCHEVKGLYFAGGTTHPGGGVPMVTLSGKVAAQMLLSDLR